MLSLLFLKKCSLTTVQLGALGRLGAVGFLILLPCRERGCGLFFFFFHFRRGAVGFFILLPSGGIRACGFFYSSSLQGEGLWVFYSSCMSAVGFLFLFSVSVWTRGAGVCFILFTCRKRVCELFYTSYLQEGGLWVFYTSLPQRLRVSFHSSSSIFILLTCREKDCEIFYTCYLQEEGLQVRLFVFPGRRGDVGSHYSFLFFFPVVINKGGFKSH